MENVNYKVSERTARLLNALNAIRAANREFEAAIDKSFAGGLSEAQSDNLEGKYNDYIWKVEDLILRSIEGNAFSSMTITEV